MTDLDRAASVPAGSPVELDAATGRGRHGVFAVPLLARDGVRITVLWIVLGSILGEFALRVGDYIDFDAGRYERLAISIARTHSLVPRVNGVDIHSFSQLYPLLIAPFFAHGFLPTDYRNAGISGAYLMSSACIPAFLLTRRLTALRLGPYLVAALTICMPWIVTSMFMMTEIAAYPASVWALYAMVVALSAPSRKHDLLALLALPLAYLARGELIVLVFVLPLALVVYELGRAPGRRRARPPRRGRPLARHGPSAPRRRLRRRRRSSRSSSTPGTGSRRCSVSTACTRTRRTSHYGRLPRSLVEHLATFSLGVGVVPLVIALAWIGANVVRPPRRPRGARVRVRRGLLRRRPLPPRDELRPRRQRVRPRPVPACTSSRSCSSGTVLAVTDERKPRWSLAPAARAGRRRLRGGEIPWVTAGSSCGSISTRRSRPSIGVSPTSRRDDGDARRARGGRRRRCRAVRIRRDARPHPTAVTGRLAFTAAAMVLATLGGVPARRSSRSTGTSGR